MRHKYTYLCGNPDCRFFGIEFKLRKKEAICHRCHWDMLTKSEFDGWADDTLAKTANESALMDAEVAALSGKPAPKLPNDTWSAPACLSGCPIATEPIIHIPYGMYQVWVGLAKAMETEWLAYLQGEITDGVYYVREMTFPDQNANGVHVGVNDNVLVPEGTIAAVHSHVAMDVFFSAEDQRHFNHPIELVVNRKGELLANGVSTLKCGSIHRGSARIVLDGAEDIKPYLDSLKARMSKEPPASAFSSERREVKPMTIQRVGRNGVQ